MRQGLLCVAVLIGAGIGLGVSSHDAKAALLPAAASPVVASALVVEAGWRRTWRRYGPDVVTPDVQVDPGAQVDLDVDSDGEVDEQVTVPGETPPLVVIVPVRPASCGQYRYWNGDRCVDARYHNPYVGPR
jgi:hypothetical protein